MGRTIRHLLWLYLFYHWYLHFKEHLSLIPVILLWAGTIGLGYVFYRISSRLIPTLLFTGLAPILLYYLFKGLFLLAAVGFEDLTWDLLLLALDRYFFFMILPMELVGLSTVLVYRSYSALSLEPAFRGLLLAALFFPEGGFRGHLYAHPLPLGISISLFLLGEVLLLILTNREPDTEKEGALRKRGKKDGIENSGIEGTDSSRWLPPFFRYVFSFGMFRTTSLSWRIRKGLPYTVLLLLALYLGYDRYTVRSLEARGGLLKAEMFRFDFTHFLTLETEIRQTKDLVLLYRRSEPIDRYLLKRYLLEGYDPGKGFFKDAASPDSAPAEIVPPHPRAFPPRETKGRKPIQQEIYLINLDPQALVSLDYPLRIVPYRTWPQSSFSRVYQVEAMALTILPLELSEVKGPGMDSKTLAYYTEYGTAPQIKALAEEITQGIDTYYDKVQAIADYLRYEYFYSLKPGKSLNGDQLSHFLFSSKKGYCSYFAFSMALLCRSLGIPARVVIGFYIDPEIELLGYYPVRSDMAHAWVEVYFEGYGWVDFDPTSRTPAPGEVILSGGQLKREDIASLLKEILSHPLETEPLPSGKVEEVYNGNPPTWNALYRSITRFFSFALLPLGIGALLLIRFRYRLKALICRSLRDRIFWTFMALLQDLAPLGFIITPSQSLKEALSDISDTAFWELFSLYQQARFSESFGRSETDRFFALLPQVRKELYGRKSIISRLLLRFHPKSFRRPIR